jgi:replicative DNA helicase
LQALAGLAATAQMGHQEAVSCLDESAVSADDFADPIASRVLPVLEARVRSGQALDFVALRELLRFSPGSAESDALYDVLTLGTPALALEHLRMVHDKATRRRCVDTLRVLAGVLRDEARPVSECVSEAQSVVGAWTLTQEVAPTMQGDVETLLTELDDVYNGRRPAVLPTGIEALDAVIGGLQPTLTVVGALPGVGKSALVAAICRNLAQRGTAVGLVSLEDDRSWLVRRLTSDLCGIGVHAMLTRRLPQMAMEAIGNAAEKAHALGRFIHIDGRGGLTAPEVVASARYMLSRGCKAVLVDHLGEVRVDHKAQRHDLEIANALSQLRQLAKSYRVPVVVMSHLTRDTGTEYDEPTIKSFAFSAAVERMARVALGLYRVKDHAGERDKTALKCAVLKQTQGISGITVELRLKAASAIVTDSPASAAARRLYEEES